MGLLGLVGLAEIALFVYRRNISPRVERPAIDAMFKKVSPVADGAIGKEEYGPPVTMAWTKDNVVEMEIPLALIDTQDGPPFVQAGPGSLLNLGLAVTDNDAEVHKQMSYAYLKTARQTTSPWFGGESAWNFAIRLVPKRSLFSW